MELTADAQAPAATAHATLRRVLNLATTAATVVAVVAWILLLRPQFLGGPAGYVVVSGISMQPTLQSGDFVVAHKQPDYRIGDVVAFRVPKGEPGAGHTVIHRITGGSPSSGYKTKGDNRKEPDMWRPRPRDIVGKQWLHVPHGGQVLGLLGQPLAMAIAAGVLVFLQVMSSGGRRRGRAR